MEGARRVERAVMVMMAAMAATLVVAERAALAVGRQVEVCTVVREARGVEVVGLEVACTVAAREAVPEVASTAAAREAVPQVAAREVVPVAMARPVLRTP